MIRIGQTLIPVVLEFPDDGELRAEPGDWIVVIEGGETRVVAAMKPRVMAKFIETVRYDAAAK